jgi:hypothetical protein
MSAGVTSTVGAPYQAMLKSEDVLEGTCVFAENCLSAWKGR